MAIDIRVPPLVGIYGPSGAGKTSDKIWAAPCGLFLASAGALTPAVSLVGYQPQHVEILDTKTADLDAMNRAVLTRLAKLKNDVDAVVVDDFSMIAQRTVRLMETKIKNKLQVYGAFRLKAAEIFDEWRSYGVAVLVDTHDMPPDFIEDDDGKPISLKTVGGPNIPGSKAGPEMVKAFDMFYRCVRDSGPGFGAGAAWPWQYTAGPWFGDHLNWSTKDRWNVAVGPKGLIPMNLGEILRFIARTHGVKYNLRRPPGKEWHEEMVAWACQAVLGGQYAEAAAVNEVARNMLTTKSSEVWEIRWVKRDIEARLAIQRLHSQASQLAALGITI